MASKRPGWEGSILAFAMIFTVLMGVSYSLSNTYRIPIPWLAIVLVSAASALALRFIRRQPRP